MEFRDGPVSGDHCKTQIVLGGIAVLIIAAVWMFGSWLIRLVRAILPPCLPIAGNTGDGGALTMYAAPAALRSCQLAVIRAILGIAAIGTTASTLYDPAVLLYGAAERPLPCHPGLHHCHLIDLEWRRHSEAKAVPSTPSPS